MSNSYVTWMAKETPSRWSVDRCSVNKMKEVIPMGFDFAACNPKLVFMGMHEEDLPKWQAAAADVNKMGLKGDEKAMELYRRYITPIAKMLEPTFEATNHKAGYACVMVNPRIACDVDKMIEVGRYVNTWAPNITLKLPMTHAAMEATEELAAEGVHITGTVGFSVAQAMAIAKAHRRGIKRAKANGVEARGANMALFTVRCCGVVEEVATDSRLPYITPEVTKWAGVAISKRIHEVYRDEGYTQEDDMWLIPAGMNRLFEVRELSGGYCLFDGYLEDIKKIDKEAEETNCDREYHIDDPVCPKALNRLMAVPYFRKMYDYNGLEESEFITFGAIQNIFANFGEAGFQRLVNATDDLN